MTITLALDTSTDVRVGVARDGVALASGAVEDPRAHAEQLMPLVERTLASAGLTLADVDALVAGVGPGPFTGLRVGVVTATTLGLVLGRGVRGVCSLDAIARQWAAGVVTNGPSSRTPAARRSTGRSMRAASASRVRSSPHRRPSRTCRWPGRVRPWCGRVPRGPVSWTPASSPRVRQTSRTRGWSRCT